MLSLNSSFACAGDGLELEILKSKGFSSSDHRFQGDHDQREDLDGP